MTEPVVGAPIRLGTRGSRLARWQADWVAGELQKQGCPVEIVPIVTEGDVQQAGPVEAIGSQGVFTKAIQRALVAREIDLAVHSLKDLPTAPVPGLMLAAAPPREAVGDALVSPVADSLDGLPPGARVGTGSRRRRSQLLHRRPDLRVGDIRGNVETRLAKLDSGEFDAIVLAQAGLQRLGLADRITAQIPSDQMLPAPGQGSLGIECRADDSATRAAAALLDCAATHAAVTAERAALARLEGGCMAALGAWGRFQGGRLLLSVVVLSDDGQRRLFEEGAGDDPQALGVEVADRLLARGAAQLLRAR
ncbi:Porphobilinogen deaminase [Pirellulimonas nuda]|uniref:Porphobilinogen deaminase n=1 Tax=Pirellulimonas nuda TaxID=2528009 RepID=A0A518DFR4_9BACT|nr:hydroxymethylbilane synthase [Pirellulimonas nuda]QDU90323.1 Porphobilinogen deaminase [Pirellulimonas nuda]